MTIGFRRALVYEAAWPSPLIHESVSMNEQDELSEDVIAGIWADHQYKIENVPGYAEAFKRVSNCLRKSIDDDDYKQSKQDKEELDRALADVYILDLMHHYRFKRPPFDK
jgi:hypothetical protein